MKFAFYFFIIAQFLNYLDVFAEKVIKGSSQLNSIKWEKVKKYKNKPLEKIIWKSYKGDENYFKNEIEEDSQFIGTKAALIEPAIWRNRTLRFTFEEIDMPDAGEHMGLYGIGAYDRLNSWLYGGITAYGAATGRRGGFFTGGYTLGVESYLTDNWILDAGGYVGAGGGGAAEDGGGLMLRPHIGLKYDSSWGALGLNYTYVDFPDGDISSDAIALSLDFPFSSPTPNSEGNELTAADYFGAEWNNLSRH